MTGNTAEQAPAGAEVLAPAGVEVFDGVAAIPCGDTLLMLWQRPARRARILRATAWVDALLARSPGSIVVCQFLLSSASPPDAEGRAIARVEALRLEPRIRCAVMVPLGDSLFRDLVRGILRAAVLIAGHGDRLKIASSERDAVDVMRRLATDLTPDGATFEAAIASLYAALRESHPGSPRP